MEPETDEVVEITHPNGAAFVHDTVFDVFTNDKDGKQQQQQQQHLVYKKVNKKNVAEPYVGRAVVLRKQENNKGKLAVDLRQ